MTTVLRLQHLEGYLSTMRMMKELYSHGGPWDCDLEDDDQELQLALESINKYNSHVYSGHVFLEQPDTLLVKDIVGNVLKCGSLSNPHIKTLRVCANKVYPKSFTIDASYVQSDVAAAFIDRAMRHVERWLEMRPEYQDLFEEPSYVPFTVRLRALHAFGPGSTVEEHVQEQHDGDHIATMMVTLGSPYKGGDAHIRCQYTGNSYHDERLSVKQRLYFNAFYTGCHYAMDRVTSGCKVVAEVDILCSVVIPPCRVRKSGDLLNLKYKKRHTVQMLTTSKKLSMDAIMTCFAEQGTNLRNAVESYYGKKSSTYQGIALLLTQRYDGVPEVEMLTGSDAIVWHLLQPLQTYKINLCNVLCSINDDGLTFDGPLISFTPILDDRDELVNSMILAAQAVDATTAVEEKVDDGVEQEKIKVLTPTSSTSTQLVDQHIQTGVHRSTHIMSAIVITPK